jgi:hypothetical protein
VQCPVAVAQPVREGQHQRHCRRGHRPRHAVRRDRHRDASLGAGRDVEVVESDAVARDHRQLLDVVDSRRRQRRGVVVEAVDVRERFRRQGVVVEEAPRDAGALQRLEVVRREGERAIRAPHVARDRDPETAISVIGHAV